MNAAKYSTLPDIDTAQDVYETDDPIPSTLNASRHKGEAGSDDEGAPSRSAIRGSRTTEVGASKDELDSSNLMEHDEASKKFRKAEKRRDRPRTHYAYPPSPTDSDTPIEPLRPIPLSRRLRALQAEMMKMAVDPGELIRGLVDVRGRLEKIRKGQEGRGRLVGVILRDGDKESESQPAKPAEAEKPNVRSIVEMDRRVGELEKLVGSSTATLDELLLSDLDRASASQHSHRRHPSQSNAAPPSQIQEQVLPLLSRLGPSLPHIPHILTRLRTLSALHSSAGQFEKDQRKMREALGELESAIGTIEKSLEENRGVVRGNVSGLENRIELLMKRVEELGRH
ncbi:hypothetical protein FB45DRAFT_987216 [Roridomyces roridus]|uniref:Dynamitin n=1 Tax=Roridomyces roridus TaxID=1738132 RepID=A0AAD7CFH8_9AGAR|nr:hypothetical protein FB45DRAFT_987216 [Roridomyces roridus]